MNRFAMCILMVASISIVGLTQSGCSKSDSDDAPPVTNPNGANTPQTTPAPDAKLVSFELSPASTTKTVGGSPVTLFAVGTFSDNAVRSLIGGTEAKFYLFNKTGDPGTALETGVFTPSDSSTGEAGVRVRVDVGEGSNRVTMTKEFTTPVPIRVVTQVSAPPSGGGGGGGGGGNPIPSSDLIASIALTNTGSHTMGSLSLLGNKLTHADGLTSDNNWNLGLPFVNEEDRQNKIASIDAQGMVRFGKVNAQARFKACAIGSIPVAVPNHPNEFWNEVVISPERTLSSGSGTSTELWPGGKAFVSCAGRFQFYTVDLETGTDITDDPMLTLAISDPTKARLVANANGTPTVIEGLNVGSFTITATYYAKSVVFNCRTLPGNPLVCQTRDGSMFVWDTHLRFAMPYKDPVDSKWVLPYLFYGERCTYKDRPAYFGPPNWANVFPLPSLDEYIDAGNGKWWAYKGYRFTEEVGVTQRQPTQYVGRWEDFTPPAIPNYGDQNAWSFPNELETSFFQDDHTYYVSGQPFAGDDLLIEVRHNAEPSQVIVTWWDKS